MTKKAFASLPGTVGEWVQGWILEDGEALVSLAVEWRGRVWVTAGGGNGGGVPRLAPKAHRALMLARRTFAPDLPFALSVEVENPLRPALGLGTSTMDVGGVLAAAGVLAGRSPSEEDLFALCGSIEPSDGTMFRGLALVDHLRGRLIERLPGPPPLWLTCLLPYRTLDTEDYRKDRNLLKAIRDRAGRHRKAYGILREGLSEGSARKVAAGATLSAILQQAILPREEWPLLLAACRECRGLGIAVAHSGTASALLFDSEEGARRGRDWIARRWDLGEIREARATGGVVETDVREE